MTNNKLSKQPIFLFFTNTLSKNNRNFLLIFALLFTLFLIAFINITSIISFILFLLISIILYRFIFDKNIKKIAGLFIFYSLVAIILFLLQYATFPEYKGFSGGLGIGTDDARFFAAAVGLTPIKIPLVYNLTYNPYSKILRVIVQILPFKNIHLLDLLFFNVFGIAFIPIFTSKVAYILTKEKNIADLSYKFSMICPFIMSNGLILVRDGWTAVLFIGSIYFLLSKRYIPLIALSTLLFYLRISSGIQLIVALLLFFYYQFHNYRSDYVKKALLFLITMIIILAISSALFPVVKQYAELEGITNNIFFRKDFVESFMARGIETSGKSSIFYSISTQPFYLRIPLGFIFFLCAPFLSIKNLTNFGIYIPRQFLAQSFSILFLFYFKYLTQSVMYIWKNKDFAMRIVAVVFFIILLSTSQMSLQFRHKTIIMPLFYILVAYGFYHKTKSSNFIGTIGVVSLFFIQLIVNIFYLS